MTTETKTAHTPGPWKAHLNVPTTAIEGHIIKADGHNADCPIASLWVGGGTEGKPTQVANARLIAAAPSLYEACRDVREALGTMTSSQFAYGEDARFRDQLDEAIALATGEETND